MCGGGICGGGLCGGDHVNVFVSIVLCLGYGWSQLWVVSTLGGLQLITNFFKTESFPRHQHIRKSSACINKIHFVCL